VATRTQWVILAVAAAAVAATLHPAPVLEIANGSDGRMFQAALGDGEAFSVTSIHSMYDEPVTEEFAVVDGQIVLTAVSSPSAAVREYFGITAAGERHAFRRSMPEVVFRVAAGAPQRLRIGSVERSFLELGQHGDRLVIRAHRASALESRLRGWIARAAP
jgi:hypothetical protein